MNVVVTIYLHTIFSLSNRAVCYHPKQNSEAKFCTAAICCYSFCTYGSWEEFQASPLSTATQNSMDRLRRAQERYCDILYIRKISFPGRQSVRFSMLSVCSVASAIEPVDRFSWHGNPIHLKVTLCTVLSVLFPNNQ